MLKPTWQDFWAGNVDNCGLMGFTFVFRQCEFKLVSFLHLHLRFLLRICSSSFQSSSVNLHTRNEPEVVLAARWSFVVNLMSLIVSLTSVSS
jgi:hypothetical protein